MDMVAGIDDESCMRLVRLFNEPEGKSHLKSNGISDELVEKLELMGISSIANLLGAIKMAKYYEMNENDMVFTIATDSMELYQSRIEELREDRGDYSEYRAAVDFDSCLGSLTTDHMLELSYWDKKRLHNLKYFTWVEQLGKDVEELDRQWYDENYWKEKYQSHKQWDVLIQEFNAKTGLLEKYK